MQSKHPLIVDSIALEVDALGRPVDWSEIFGNSHPVEIEIGMGKGTFITEQSRKRPEINFLGIEWARWFWRYASDRLRRNGCVNARTVRAEASFFLSEHVSAASVSALHIYFPDPWPKKRHHKRRLIQPGFLRIVQRVLRPGGVLQIVTDHEGYFLENIRPAVCESQLQVIDYVPPGSAGEGELAGTNFERKYARAGRPFHAIAAVKKSSENKADSGGG